jgi:hypothetical protein
MCEYSGALGVCQGQKLGLGHAWPCTTAKLASCLGNARIPATDSNPYPCPTLHSSHSLPIMFMANKVKKQIPWPVCFVRFKGDDGSTHPPR